MEEVRKWLDGHGFSEYKDKFRDEGYDDLETISEIASDDLEDLGITKKGHVKKFLLKVKELKKHYEKNELPGKKHPRRLHWFKVVSKILIAFEFLS